MASGGIEVRVVGTANLKDWKRAEREMRKMRAAADTLDNRFRRAGQTMNRFGRTMKTAGSTMTRSLTAPILGAGVAAVKSAADFESSFAKIEGLVGVAGSDIAELQTAARELGPAYGISANEAAEALFFITSAGLRGSDAIETLESSLKASAIGLGETAVVADLATSALNAYGADTLGAAEATDVLTNAVRLGKLEPGQLSAAMGQVLPVASAMGVEFHEVGAAFAAMSRTGTDANVAATQLRQIMATVLKPTVEAERALNDVGLSAEGLREQIREKGLLSVLQTLVDRLGGNAAATSEVFGNIRALSGVLDLMGANADVTAEIFDGMTQSLGTTDEAFAVTADTANQQFKVALEELRGAMIDLGQDLMPIATDIADSVRGMVGAFQDLEPEQQANIIKMAGLLAVGGPLIIVAGQLTTAIGGLATAFAFLAANPIVAVVAGLGGLIAYSIIAGKETRDYAYELGEATETHDQYAEALARARHGYPMLLEQMEAERELHRFNAIAAAQHADRLADLHAELNAQADAEVERFKMAASRERENRQRRETEEILGEIEDAFGGVNSAYGEAAERSVRLDEKTRDLLRSLNDTYVGTSESGDALAQYARDLLAAGSATEDVESEIERLATAVRSDLNGALRDAESRLGSAQRAFDEYRNSIADGISQGNTLADAARRQDEAIRRVAEAEAEYAEAQQSGDPERISKAAEDLADAKNAQRTFNEFLGQGAETAQIFADQIDQLRLAGASLAVTQEIAQLGAETGGRIIEELLAGGQAAIEQANSLTAAVKAASMDAARAAAEQFYGAGVRAGRAMVDGLRDELDELDDLLENIVGRIAAAFERQSTAAPTPPAPTGGGGGGGGGDDRRVTPTFDLPPAQLASWERRFAAGAGAGIGGLRFLADGGLVTGPTLSVIGEAGPEMVVPLDRVDEMGGGNTINVTVTSADPQAVVEAIRKYTRSNGPLGATVIL